MRKAFYLLAFVLLFSACTKKDKQAQKMVSSFEYAENFVIEHTDSCVVVTILNPWIDGEIMQRLYLTHNQINPKDGVVINLPIKSIAIASSPHIEPLVLLNEIDKITAICSPEWVYNEQVKHRYESGEIISLGDSHNINNEMLLSASPDVLMITGYNGQNEAYNRLAATGVKVVNNIEWMEKTLLARAEWIKLFGVLFEKEEQANEIFDEIVQNYNEASKIAQAVENKPSVMCGSNYKGTWYMPDGASYMARAFADAGANYYYKEGQTSSSLPLNFETVMLNFSTADIWLNAPTTTIEELLALDERHRYFNPIKNGSVYAFKALENEAGANDFWESGVYHPDIVLKDLIWAVHPEIMEDYTPRYILKLQ